MMCGRSSALVGRRTAGGGDSGASASQGGAGPTRARRRSGGQPVERELLGGPVGGVSRGRPRPVRCAGAPGGGGAGDDEVVRRCKGAPSGGSPFFRLPPAELADGFGREAALPAPGRCVRERDSPQYSGGSPARPGGRLGGVRSDSPDGDVATDRT